MNIIRVQTVVASPTKYAQEYISVHKLCVSYIHPSTKDKIILTSNQVCYRTTDVYV